MMYLHTVVCQLKSINRKPMKDKITDKLLIGLHFLFATICTNLSLHTLEPSVATVITDVFQFI
jgi:hypothetical protein